jgi:hypothetical protein
MVPLALDRQHGETQLWVKDVRVGQQRYIVSLNEAEAKIQGDRRRVGNPGGGVDRNQSDDEQTALKTLPTWPVA